MFNNLIDTLATKSILRAFRHRNFVIVELSSWLSGAGVWFYRIGLQSGQFSLATAAGLFKGVIGMVLIVAAHTISKRLTGKGVW